MNIRSSLIRLGGSLLAMAATALLVAPTASPAAEATTPAPAAAPATEKLTHPQKPLLWKVEGGGLEKPSYLFGTIHLGDAVVTTLHPAAQKAFEEATAFHAEISMDASEQMAVVGMVLRKDGKSLSDSIGEELSGQLEQELKRINPALDATPFQSMKTFYIALALPLLKEQLGGIKPLDMVLWERAKAAGKTTAGIETMEGQMIGFTSLSEPEQIEMLSDGLKAMKKARDEGESRYDKLRDAYLSGDPLQVRGLAMDWGSKELQKKLEKSLLHDRDVIMADYIARTVREKPATTQFFAVGAAHYCGEVSILSHLEKAGFKITRIEQ